MKLNKIIVAATVLLTISIGAFYGCKKTTKAEKEFDEVAAKAAVKAKIQAEGRTEINVINQRAEGYTYTDKFGVEHTKLTPTNSLTSTACNGGVDCVTYEANGGSDDLEPGQFVLTSVSRTSVCYTAGGSNNSNIDVTWKVSVPYTLVLENMFNTTFKSKGIIKFYNTTSSTPYLQYNNILPFIINNLGQNPDCPALTDFEVKYKLTGVPNTNFENGKIFKCGFTSFTNCGSQNSTGPNPLVPSLYNFTGNYITQPCLRTDKVYMTPDSGPGNCMSAAGVGNTSTCTFPYGYVLPNQHVLEYKQNSSTTWSTIPPFTPYDVIFINAMLPNTGLWNVRYKNRVTGSSPCDGTWYYENWNL